MPRVYYDSVREFPSNIPEFKGDKTIEYDGRCYKKVGVVFGDKHSGAWRVERFFKAIAYKIAGVFSKDYQKLSARAWKECKTGKEKLTSYYFEIKSQPTPEHRTEAFKSFNHSVPPNENSALISVLPTLPRDVYNVMMATMSTSELAKLSAQLKIASKESNASLLASIDQQMVKRFKETNNSDEVAEIFITLGPEILIKKDCDLGKVDVRAALIILEAGKNDPKIVFDSLFSNEKNIKDFMHIFSTLSLDAKQAVVDYLSYGMKGDISSINRASSHNTRFILYAYLRAFGDKSLADEQHKLLNETLELLPDFSKDVDGHFLAFFSLVEIINKLKGGEHNYIRSIEFAINQFSDSLKDVGSIGDHFNSLFNEVVYGYLNQIKYTEDPKLLIRLKNLGVIDAIPSQLYRLKFMLEGGITMT